MYMLLDIQQVQVALQGGPKIGTFLYTL